jgi:hypothetical protein
MDFKPSEKPAPRRPTNESRRVTPPPSSTPARAPTVTPSVTPAVSDPADALVLLSKFEASQQKSVAAVRAIVELLIEKGFFTRDEYLAKMRR